MKPFNLEAINRGTQNTLTSLLGIRVTRAESGLLEGEMPVDSRTHQNFGILHGGASVVLAETLGSIGANLLVDADHHAVGLEINANHVRSVESGKVLGVATALHVGKTTQLWEILIRSESGDLVCVSRLTIAVRPKSRSKSLSGSRILT